MFISFEESFYIWFFNLLIFSFHAELICSTNMILWFGSSFNDKPVNEAAVGPIGKELFEREQEDLLSDLKDIPKKACDRRVSFLYPLV